MQNGSKNLNINYKSTEEKGYGNAFLYTPQKTQATKETNISIDTNKM